MLRFVRVVAWCGVASSWPLCNGPVRRHSKGLALRTGACDSVDQGRQNDARPTHLVECKWADAPVDRGLRYLKLRVPDCETWQLSAVGTKDFVSPEGIRVAPALALPRRLA